MRLVLDEGKTVSRVAQDLDLTASALASWVKQARADRSNGKTGLTTEERAELAQLRRENRTLRLERDISKKPRCIQRVHPTPEETQIVQIPRRINFSPSDRLELWRRWKAGSSISDIARALRREPGTVHSFVSAAGGIARAL